MTLSRSSTLTLVSILVCVGYSSQQCPLNGVLCQWNIYGFNSQNDSGSKDQILYTETNNSYVISMLYSNNTEPTCRLHIQYELSTDALLLVYRINSSRSFNILSTVQHHNTSSVVDVGESSGPFMLMVKAVFSGDGNSNASIKSVYLADCTPKEMKLRFTSCSVVNSRMCDGWTVKNSRFPANEKYMWTPKEDYFILNSSVTVYGTTHSRLLSAVYPYQVGSECKVSLLWKNSGFVYDYKIPRIVARIIIDGDYYLHKTHSLPYTRSEDWQQWTGDIKSVNAPVKEFQLELLVHASLGRSGSVMIKDIRFSDSCFPQLPLSLPHPEALGASQMYAEKISVAGRSTSYTFQSCGSTGRTGPTSNQCQTVYAAAVKPFVNAIIDDVNMPGVQQWQVTKTNKYEIIAYGATGGFGIDTVTTTGMIRGIQYLKVSNTSLPCWPSRMHIRLKLYDSDKLYIVVGQAGSTACQENSRQDCKNNNITTERGGGGAGGGASIVLLEREDKVHLLAVVGGGGGMGRNDMPLHYDHVSYLKKECERQHCNGSNVRPGFGGSAEENVTKTSDLLRQDGRSLQWNFTAPSLQGGRGCREYRNNYETQGGFGGGGGGCTAGGGGGGYKGGGVSELDNTILPGEQGTSYYNKELVELVRMDRHDPYNILQPEGIVEITEVPPPCACNDDDRKCRWLDGNYERFHCLCGAEWVADDQLDLCEEPVSAGPAVYKVILAVSGVLLLLLFMVFMCCYFRSRINKTKQLNASRHFRLDINPNYDTYDGLPDVLTEERIKIVRCLGEGRFSKVYEARLALTDSWDSEEVTVAVKKPVSNTEESRLDFLQEARTISEFNHPNIMKIIGICELSDGGIGIVMDVLKGGDLRTFLKEHRIPGAIATSCLLFGDLIRISCEIASACKYLEEMKFIHRDIAARNVLLTEKGKGRVAKISDFGLSRDVNHGDYCRHSPLSEVPIRWYPPEAVKNNVQTTKSDVWSYGVLLWEIFTLGDQPYPGLENRQVADHITAGFTMDSPTICPQPVGELMRKCWLYNPDERPFFSFIHQQLCKVLQNTQLMSTPLNETKQPRLASVTSSASSGFDETLESPSSLSCRPLLGDTSFPEGFHNGMCT